MELFKLWIRFVRVMCCRGISSFINTAVLLFHFFLSIFFSIFKICSVIFVVLKIEISHSHYFSCVIIRNSYIALCDIAFSIIERWMTPLISVKSQLRVWTSFHTYSMKEGKISLNFSIWISKSGWTGGVKLNPKFQIRNESLSKMISFNFRRLQKTCENSNKSYHYHLSIDQRANPNLQTFDHMERK